MSEGGSQGSGLKAQWGVADPQVPSAGAPGSGEQASRLREVFETAIAAINESLQSVKTSAEASRHQSMDGERQQLVSQFQDTLGKVDPANPAQAQGDIDSVLAAAQALQSRAASLAQEGAAALANWQARAAAFDEGVAQVVEMNDWGYTKAAPFQAVADAIRARVNARKFTDALAGVDRFLQPLAAAYADYQKHKQAQGTEGEATAGAAAKAEDSPGFFGSIAGAVAGVAGRAADTAVGAAKAVGKAADQVRGAVATAAGQAANAAADAVIGAANTVGNSADAVGGAVGEVVGSAIGSNVGTAVGGTVGAVKGLAATGPIGAITPAVGAAGGVVGGATGAVKGSASGAAFGQAAGGDAGEAIGGVIGGAARWLAGAVSDATGRPPQTPPKSLQNRPRSGAPITAKPPVALKPVKGADGKTLQVGQAPDGTVTLVAPPPKIETITFSGGGGKGAALPGAVRALERSGVLQDVKTVSGASVGSMTAALVAAGITAEEFEEIGNDPAVAGQIKEGKSMPEALFDGGLSGEGLEDLVRKELSRSVSKRIVEYVQAQGALGTAPDPHVLDIARKLADGKTGVTFRDLRDLSKVIPQIKEVAISGSYMSEVNTKTGKPKKGTEQSQLVMFDADTQPDLEVALAVHASAALPPVFKPVDVPLSNGTTARFQDGGVLNNAPTPDSVGAERQLDPMPEGGGMTFVFEDDASRQVIEGKAAPKRSRIADWLTGAENSAAEYGKNRGLADKPQDVVMLPLKFTVPPKGKGGKPEEKDFSGFMSGTVNFDMAVEDKLQLQALADETTSEHIKSRREPRAREFASMEQMLMCVPRADLVAMAGDGLAGAQEALDFRDKVSGEVSGLIPLVLEHPDAATAARNPKVQAVLARLDGLAGKSPERQGVVAREMNRSPRLDGLIQACKSAGSSATLKACAAANDALRARAHAKEVLRAVVYPKMVRTDADGVDGNLLKLVDDRLRAAASIDEVNEALQLAIKHFRKRRDLLGIKGHLAFAQELEDRLMK